MIPVFFLRLLDNSDPLCENAEGYYRYFLQNEIPMMVSTVATGEFCVKGSLDELPMKNLRVLPYNLPHSQTAGKFADILFTERNKGNLNVDRVIIPNDVKMFAQADVEEKIGYYITSDAESEKMITFLSLSDVPVLDFEFVNIETKHTTQFGLLDL